MATKGMLANEIRPTSLDDVIGQDHLVGPNGVITKMLAKNKLLSLILYGKAGVGKTTIAKIIVSKLECDYLEINATSSNKKDLEQAISMARLAKSFVLIIDEIHRLNKDKQDILLPHIESGLITLIGITNSNPYHSINTAIRSRLILLEVKNIEDKDLEKFVLKMLLNTNLKNDDRFDLIAKRIVRSSNQDVRYAINQVELLDIIYQPELELEELFSYLSSNVSYDKNESYYYDVISSLQKSIRGSDVNAALFYLAILIIAEDLDIIERRLSIIAYEDVGLAAPEVVDRVLNALQVARMNGFPEARIPLAFCVVDLALASKSNKALQALDEAIDCVKNSNYTFNEYLRATPKDMKQQELYWSIPYENRHLIQYLPNELKNKEFYHPNRKSSYEKHLATLNDYLNAIKRTNNLSDLLSKINEKD